MADNDRSIPIIVI